MLTIKCITHNVNYRIPQTNEEFLSGDYHNDVISVQDHIDEFPDCIFQEVIID